jgi:hypothetical protein
MPVLEGQRFDHAHEISQEINDRRAHCSQET